MQQRVRGRKRMAIAKIIALIVIVAAALSVAVTYAVAHYYGATKSDNGRSTSQALQEKTHGLLYGKQFYVDNSRPITQLAAAYARDGRTQDATLMSDVAAKPGSTWLVGPNASDPGATKDIKNVERTSGEAASQGTVPVYILYAIPKRDTCAQYSSGGFGSDEAYSAWVTTIVAALRSQAIFVVEPDSIAQTINTNCLSSEETVKRYALLHQTVHKLHDSSQVLAVYIDAGHSEWFSDPAVLAEPLRQAGIEHADGIAVNVSYHIKTTEIIQWSKGLLALLDAGKGVIIDTSRNGQGAPPQTVTGDARWCNAPGRGIGKVPSTVTGDATVHAYFWGKNIGESDGACFGNPPAGTFVPGLALELARNAER